MYDLVIRNGTVFDGTGNPGVSADIAVVGDRIAALGRADGTAECEIEARGLYVAPGFIDIHSHSDYTLLIDPRSVSSISQGVTTEVIGNCGFGCAPVLDPRIAADSIYGFDQSIRLDWRTCDEYFVRLQAARPAVNVVPLVPNGQLRRSVLGVIAAPASEEQLRQMIILLEEGLDAGAFGLSTGLEYPAETGASPEEVQALCRVVARRHRLYATHTRYRDAQALEGIDEALAAARRTRVQLQISHLVPRLVRGNELERSITMVERARADGIDVRFDMHTRLFGFTHLRTLLPPWLQAKEPDELRQLLRDPSQRARAKQHVSIVNGGGWDRVTLIGDRVPREWLDRPIASVAASLRKHPHDLCLDHLLSLDTTSAETMAIINAYSEDQQKEVFCHPLCLPGSDATALAPDGPLADRVFHGAYSWAAWYYRFMVRDHQLVPPHEAIYRLTGLPASILHLSQIGRLAAGARADISIFDPVTFRETATLSTPNRMASGMRHVVVGGQLAMYKGNLTYNRNGLVFRA